MKLKEGVSYVRSGHTWFDTRGHSHTNVSSDVGRVTLDVDGKILSPGLDTPFTKSTRSYRFMIVEKLTTYLKTSESRCQIVKLKLSLYMNESVEVG